MAQPLANCGEVDPRLQKMHGRGMADDMGMERLFRQGADLGGGQGAIFFEKVPNPEAGQRHSSMIEEEKRFGILFTPGRDRCDQLQEKMSGLIPERAEAAFPPFSLESDLIGRIQADVTKPEVQDFLDPGSGIVHQREQGIVAQAVGRVFIDTVKNSGYFTGLKIVDRSRLGPSLEGDAQDPLEFSHMFRVFSAQEADERVKSRQPGISGLDAILPERFKMRKKGDGPLHRDVAHVEFNRRLSCLSGQVLEVQHKSVPVTSNGPEAQATQTDEIFSKEPFQGWAQLVWVHSGCHGTPPGLTRRPA